LRRGLECSLINFCSIGDIKVRKNRKINNRRRIDEEIPKSIEGISPHLDYHVPHDEGMEDSTAFSDLLDDAEDVPDEDDGDEPEDDQEGDDVEMIESSEEEEMDDKEPKGCREDHRRPNERRERRRP